MKTDRTPSVRAEKINLFLEFVRRRPVIVAVKQGNVPSLTGIKTLNKIRFSSDTEGPVAFIHPRSCHGVLVELIEAPGGPSWTSLGY
jgi:hypothetical protein